MAKLKKEVIVIRKNSGRGGCFNISSSNDVFKERYLIVKVYDDYITFIIPSIDYNGKSYSVCRDKTQGHLTISSDKNIEGHYVIDEEYSNEDEITINLI